MSDSVSVRSFAEEYKSRIQKLDVLICNAAIAACPYSKTKDGHEMQFGTNHLGHWLLTCLLQDLLLKSESPRHINVSSEAHAAIKNFDLDEEINEKN